MTLAIYRYILAPLAILLLPFAALFNRKIAAGLRMRREARTLPEFAIRPFWIHAASGEFEYAKAVIRELKTRAPHIPVLVTYFSPTYAKNVQNFPGVDYAMPLPLDLPGPTSGFLKRMNPRALLLARTDFWPELLQQCRRRKIPVHVFAYTQKDPANIGAFAKAWARLRLQLVDQIYCVSPEDEANIRSLGVDRPVSVLGDTRYDQVAHRLENPKPLPANMRPTDALPCFIAGSTWTEDEDVVIPALKPLLRESRLRLILVPHEPTPEHIAKLQARLAKEGLSYQLYSAGGSWSGNHVLLVDQVGWLAELYAWADLAFVGGSFRRTVHSVMEALGAGLMTFVGPLHGNNREAVEFQKVFAREWPAVTSVRNAAEWTGILQERLETDFTFFRHDLKAEFQNRLGASQRLADSLKTLLD